LKFFGAAVVGDDDSCVSHGPLPCLSELDLLRSSGLRLSDEGDAGRGRCSVLVRRANA